MAGFGQRAVAAIAVDLRDAAEVGQMGDWPLGLAGGRIDKGDAGRVGTVPQPVVAGTGPQLAVLVLPWPGSSAGAVVSSVKSLAEAFSLSCSRACTGRRCQAVRSTRSAKVERSRSMPVAVRHADPQPLAARAAAISARHESLKRTCHRYSNQDRPSCTPPDPREISGLQNWSVTDAACVTMATHALSAICQWARARWSRVSVFMASTAIRVMAVAFHLIGFFPICGTAWLAKKDDKLIAGLVLLGARPVHEIRHVLRFRP